MKFAVGKLETGVAVLLSTENHLVELPVSVLPVMNSREIMANEL